MTNSAATLPLKASSESISLFEIACLTFVLFLGQQLDVPPSFVVASNLLSYTIVFFLIIRRLDRIIQFGLVRPSLILILGLILTSVIWSEDPLLSFRAAAALCRSTLIGIYLASKYSIRAQMQILTWVMLFTLTASSIAAIVAPEYAYRSVNAAVALKGILAHKQSFGVSIGLAFSLFICSFFVKIIPRWLGFYGLGLSFLLSILSASKTSLIIIFVLLISTILYKSIRQSEFIRVATLAILGLGTGAIVLLISTNIGTILVDILGKDLELNGRVPLWQLAISEGMKKPWLGYGYNAFWTTDAANYAIVNSWAGLSRNVIERRVIFHSHNGFIDFFLQLGGIGLFALLVCFLAAFFQAFKLTMMTRKIEHFWVLQVLCVSTIANISESNLFSPNSIFSILLVSLSVAVTVQLQSMKTLYAYQKTFPQTTES